MSKKAKGGAAVNAGVNDGLRLEVFKNALYEDIARRLLTRQLVSEIAVAVGLTKREVYYILRKEDFREVYSRVRDKVYSTVDDVLIDNRADILDRITALQPVAFRQLVSMIEQGHGTNGSRPSERARFEAIKLGMGLGGHVPVEKRVVAEIPVTKLPADQMKQLVGVFSRAVERVSGSAVVESDPSTIVEAEVAEGDDGSK